ncbi:MAG: assimilatory sulfite reductase (NADPH) flavoprotein subunit [Thiolinea sp.]
MTLLNEQQFKQISTAVNDLTPAQLAWVGGYLSGLSLGKSESNIIPFPQINIAPVAAQPILSTTILYGSQTGNSRGVAEQLQQHLITTGTEQVSLQSLSTYRPQQLKKEQRVLFVVSTHGNGEPPDDALGFFNFLNSQRAPQLDGIYFAVLGLGDSAYDEFCQTGRELDQRLEELGGERWLPRVDCDVDYQDAAREWQQAVLGKLKSEQTEQSAQSVPSVKNIPLEVKPSTLVASNHQALGTVDNPYQAELLSAVPLTDPGSDKDVLHLEFSLGDSDISYQPGDILAVQVNNDPQLVTDILQHTGLSADVVVTLKQQKLSLQSALQEKCELTQISRRQLQSYAELTGHQALLALIKDKARTPEWLANADWLDVLLAYPARLEAQVFVDLLRPLQPRQYSIASSAAAHPEEVHILVKRVEYEHLERQHLGAASNWLARLTEGDQARIYIKPNANFSLPENPDTKIIMIGAGTGVAPYRSFLFEREACGITGNSWLFFGEQHFRNDFLYQAEWLQHLSTGTLERMSVAFSRDQAEKVYVQQRLLEEADQVWQWLQDGAHIYVCGDMNHMAKDVHNALLQIAADHGGYSIEQAAIWLDELRSARRYQRDVY